MDQFIHRHAGSNKRCHAFRVDSDHPPSSVNYLVAQQIQTSGVRGCQKAGCVRRSRRKQISKGKAPRHVQGTFVYERLATLSILWWGGSHPYQGVLVWSEHLNRWHSPRDRQSSILSQSCSSGRFPPLCCCCPRAPTPLQYLSLHVYESHCQTFVVRSRNPISSSVISIYLWSELTYRHKSPIGQVSFS